MDRATTPSSPANRSAPPAEVEIDTALVRALLESQHSDLAALPVQPVDAGWDNAMFRLGESFAVRLSRRSVGAVLIEHEQEWLPGLAALLPLPIPAPVRFGQPGCGYPWRWSVVPWLAGQSADLLEPNGEQTERLATFFRALHVAAPSTAPRNESRGVPLRQRGASVEQRMRRLEQETDLVTSDIRRTWDRALDAPMDIEPTWIHGDLHARNVLVDRGAISGIIDWGDVCAGDRATDLAAIWMLFAERHAREKAMRLCGDVSDATWSRARGWAILFGVVLSDAGSAGDRRHALIGARTLRRIAEEA
jgi:aminoglycoside phosphotransferase (APT) family kinase protein